MNFLFFLSFNLLIDPSFATNDEQQVITCFPGGLGFRVIRRELKKSQIIPQVLEDFQPKCYILPSYSGKPVKLGNEFKQDVTKQVPRLRVLCPDLKSGDVKGLVVALTDPDAPSREDPKWGEMCHWIGVLDLKKGKKGGKDDEGKGEWKEGEVLDEEFEVGGVEGSVVEYKPPGPPEKTGYHRYVFVLLEGDTSNLTAPSERQHWGTGKERHGVRDWIGDEGLGVVGANWFVEENEVQEEEGVRLEI